MTVKYLRNLQRRQISSAVAADPTVAAKFTVGFNECASEVARYLNNAHGINEDVRGRLLGHLTNCVQNTNTQQIQMGQAFIQPLHVQIPATQNGLGQSDNLLVAHAQTNGFTTPLTATVVQGNTAFTISPESVFNSSRLSNASLLKDTDQKHSNSLYVHCSSNSSSFGHSSTPTKISGVQQRPNASYSESFSPERIGFRPPMTSTPDYKLSTFSTSPDFASASAALKEEKLWRPW